MARFIQLDNRQIPAELLDRMLNEGLDQAELILRNLEGLLLPILFRMGERM